MRNCATFLLILMLSIFLANQAYAIKDPLVITPLNNNITMHAGNSVAFEFLVENNQDTADDFVIEVSGDRMEWYQPAKLLIHMEGATSQELDINFYPFIDGTGNFVYELKLYSQKFPDTSKTEKIYLNILDHFILNDFSVSKTDSTLEFKLDMDSAISQNVNIKIDVRDGAGNSINKLEAIEEIEATETVSRSLSLPKLLAGKYSIELEAVPNSIGKSISKTREFEIEAIHNVVESTERIANPLYDVVNVIVTNNGNVVENDYVTYQQITKDFVTGFVLGEPETCDELGSQKTCKYALGDLAPGQTAKITYRVDYWPTYLQFGILTIIVLLLIVATFMRATKPTVRKRYIRKGAQRHSVILEIRNPYFHHLGDAVLRDWVSPIATVSQQGFEAVGPAVKRTEAGTELIWKLGNIKPREHRVVGYKIETMIEGQIRMPRATLRYFDKRGNQTIINSRPLMVE